MKEEYKDLKIFREVAETFIEVYNLDLKKRDLIFQEFKGTGNCELVLDRAIAEDNIFPAINVMESGTRKEECLYTENELKKINSLRKALSIVRPREKILMLRDLVKKFPTNDMLLSSIPD